MAALMSSASQRQPRRIRNRRPCRRLPQFKRNPFLRSQRLRTNRNKPFRLNLAAMEFVNRNSVPGIAFLFRARISNRTHRSVKMLSIRAEHEAKKITLMRVLSESLIRIIRQSIRLQIKHRNRLRPQRVLSSIPIVQQSRVAPIRADRNRRGETIRTSNAPRRLEQSTSCW